MATPEDIKNFINLISDLTGVDFNAYSEKSFFRRIDKIETDYGLSINEITYKIKTGKMPVKSIIEDITVNTTELFRDTVMWGNLYKQLKQLRQHQDHIRVLHLGVSSGEELYSVKILLNELKFTKMQSVGVDLNSQMIKEAEKAVYKNNIIADYLENYNKVVNETDGNISKNNIQKYITYNKKNDEISINDELKKHTSFFVDDVINSDLSKYGNFDLIMCRNILIYFNLDVQNKILFKIYKILNPEGMLVLGAHESIYAPLSSKFGIKNNIYIKN